MGNMLARNEGNDLEEYVQGKELFRKFAGGNYLAMLNKEPGIASRFSEAVSSMHRQVKHLFNCGIHQDVLDMPKGKLKNFGLENAIEVAGHIGAYSALRDLTPNVGDAQYWQVVGMLRIYEAYLLGLQKLI